MRTGRYKPIFSQDKYRHRGMRCHFLCHTPQSPACHARVSVATHDDDVHLLGTSNRKDPLCWHTPEHFRCRCNIVLLPSTSLSWFSYDYDFHHCLTTYSTLLTGSSITPPGKECMLSKEYMFYISQHHHRARTHLTVVSQGGSDVQRSED